MAARIQYKPMRVPPVDGSYEAVRQQLESMGAYVSRGWSRRDVWEDFREYVLIQWMSATDADLRAFPAIDFSVSLDLSYSKMTDVGIGYLSQLANLEILNVSRTNVTDRGMARIARFPAIERLYCGACPITDRGLESLTKLERLNDLSLGSTYITSEGVAHLAAHVNLQWLDLGSS